MDWQQALYSVLGGGLIGIAVTIMLLFNGRVTGISGILASAMTEKKDGVAWRWMFLAGLVTGGLLVEMIRPELFVNSSGRSVMVILVAGLLVGYGTVMGGGCTSGHGICGMSRLSVRSLVATATFMCFGFLTVQLVRYFIGGAL